MKIVFMGTPEFAVESLRAMVEAGYDIIGVVTQPDREKGRGKEVQMTPVKKYALSKNIPIFQPDRIKKPEAMEQLRQWKADFFVVAAFGQILSKEILEMPTFGCINVHASLLPKYRGAAPIQWAILNGEQETGITIMKMETGIDTGDILAQKAVPILETDTGDSLFEKMSIAGAELLVETLPYIKAGQIVARRQDESEATQVTILQKEMGKVDWRRSARELDCLVRGLNSWPGAYCNFREKKLKIWVARAISKAQMLEHNIKSSDAEPGEAVLVTKEAVYVMTGDGFLQLQEIQLESKKRMFVKDFLVGYHIKPGEKF